MSLGWGGVVGLLRATLVTEDDAGQRDHAISLGYHRSPRKERWAGDQQLLPQRGKRQVLLGKLPGPGQGGEGG